MGGVGSASAKLILFGEHAAVYGHTAIGVSLPERTTVRLQGTAGSAWDLRPVPAGDRPVVGRLAAAVEELLPGLRARGRSAVHVQSAVVRGAGFGSSAALCSAFVRAALAWTEGTDAAGDLDRAWSIAHAAERLFHGTPSGIDTGLSLRRGVFALAPRPPALPACRPLPCPRLLLVVAAIPRDAACGALIARLGERLRSGDTEATRSMEALGAIALDARDLMEAGGPLMSEGVGACADRAMDHLRRLGVGSPLLDVLIEAGRGAGGLGGKLSGAGGGGAFFVVAGDTDAAARVARAIEADARRRAIPLASAARVLEVGGAAPSESLVS